MLKYIDFWSNFYKYHLKYNWVMNINIQILPKIENYITQL